jgi:hypothetical protein
MDAARGGAIVKLDPDLMYHWVSWCSPCVLAPFFFVKAHQNRARAHHVQKDITKETNDLLVILFIVKSLTAL